MDFNFNILDKFEIKLKEFIENSKNQNKQLNELDFRYKNAINSSKRAEHLYELEVEKCRQLSDSLIKLQFESKISLEKQTIELKEENSLHSTQIDRMSQQVSHLKQQLATLQTKCSDLEQLLIDKQNESQKHFSLKSVVNSELTQIQNRTDALNQYLQSIDTKHSELTQTVKSVNDLNSELKKCLNERNNELKDQMKDNQNLKTLLDEFRSKLAQTEHMIKEKDLNSFRLTQQNDLQKQEIIELRQRLKNSIHENSDLAKKLTQNNLNSIESIENELITENTSQTTAYVDEDIRFSD